MKGTYYQLGLLFCVENDAILQGIPVFVIWFPDENWKFWVLTAQLEAVVRKMVGGFGEAGCRRRIGFV